MAATGVRVRILTTMNAISVDHANWRVQDVPFLFGGRAARRADAYVRTGGQPTFIRSPYILESVPAAAIRAAAPKLQAVIQNGPHYGVATRAELFLALRAGLPNLVGFKEFWGRRTFPMRRNISPAPIRLSS
jgi:predicted aconitase